MYSINEMLVPPRLQAPAREKVAKEILGRKTPDDVVAVLFSFLQADRIPLDVKTIHHAIYSIKAKYPDMLEDFVFSKRDAYPFSKLLERVLFRLQNSNLISTLNPDFRECLVPREAKDYVQKNILPIFRSDEQEKLHRMGEMFEGLVLHTS